MCYLHGDLYVSSIKRVVLGKFLTFEPFLNKNAHFCMSEYIFKVLILFKKGAYFDFWV